MPGGRRVLAPSWSERARLPGPRAIGAGMVAALPIALVEALGVWVVYRVALSITGFFAAISFPSLLPVYVWEGYWFLPEWAWRTLAIWTRWDGQRYLQVAQFGYPPNGVEAAFFPLYPLAIRALATLLGGDYLWAALIIPNLAFLIALALLYQIVREDHGARVARRTLLYLAVFPTAFFFAAAYTESLFLALSLGAFLAARRRHWVLMGVLAGLAMFTRSTGLALIVPLGWECWRQTRAAGGRLPRGALWLALVPLSLLLIMGFHKVHSDQPLLPLAVQATEWKRVNDLPWQTLLNGVRQALDFNDPSTVPPPWAGEGDDYRNIQNLTNAAATLLFLGLTVATARRQRVSHTLYMGVSLIFLLMASQIEWALWSMPRFVLMLFPGFVALALWGERPFVHRLYLFTALPLLGLMLLRFITWYWVA
jgi:hypothetical protein